MQRAWVIIGATVLGLGGLVAFDQHQFGNPFAFESAGSELKLPTGAAAPGSTAISPLDTGTTAPDPTQPSTDTQPQTPTQQAAPPAVRRAAGDSVPNPYGSVQVRVTVNGGKLTRVTFLDLPYGDPTSQSISDQVAPVLAQQAIDAQSAQVAGISGATYTSDAYRQSLQSALDKLQFGK